MAPVDKMGAAEITRRLQDVRNQQRSDRRQDVAVTKVAELMSKLEPFDQLMVMCSMQASLMMEIAEFDKDKAIMVWQASWNLSGRMMNDFLEDKMTLN